MTTRRGFVTVLAAHFATASLFAGAQSRAKAPRVALVVPTALLADMSGPNPSDELTRIFLRRLRELGYQEGRDIVIERRSAEGKWKERYPMLMKELVDLQVDVIVTLGPGVEQARRATSTIPIVAWIDDPIAAGLTTSLSRPTKNITGVIWEPGLQLIGKKLQLLKQIAPKSQRVAFLDWKYVDAQATPATHRRRVAAQAAARDLGMKLVPVGIDKLEDFEQAFSLIDSERADSIMDFGSTVTSDHRHRIIEFAAQRQLPAIYSGREGPDDGGLMSYGQANESATGHRLAEYVDRILKGAKPADLPFEQPTQFELVINSKTAARLGLTIPQSLLLVAEVVDKGGR